MRVTTLKELDGEGPVSRAMCPPVEALDHACPVYDDAVARVLDDLDARLVLADQQRVVLKPNLVNASPFPVTTPFAFTRGVARYVKSVREDIEVIIAEGCGDAVMETDEVFDRLGYTAMAQHEGVGLQDLNAVAAVRMEDASRAVHREIHLAGLVMESYVISLPVLKAHSLSMVTGSLKNMMGALPPERYGGAGSYKKSRFHPNLHASIVDLNHYRAPDLTLMDATVGLCEYHLGGPRCEPPVGLILASFDALALDREAAGLLGLDWRRIPHLSELE